MEIYITGTGVISALGLNTGENLHGLLSQKTGISHQSFRDLEPCHLGNVSVTNETLQNELALDEPTSRTALLALKAALEAWGETPADENLKTGVISGNSVGGMDFTERYLLEQVTRGFTMGADHFVCHPCGYSTSLIAARIPNARFCNTISTACSSGANSILQAVQLMKAGKLDRAIAGGTDALSSFTISGFSSLMIFDQQVCKPFDANRNGLNLGEGAGYILLENAESVERSGNKILGKVTGFGIANDSYHQTALSPEGKGASMAMGQALARANLSTTDIDYINTHGTSTENNDLVELTAILSLFGDTLPPFASTKSYTGHTLGASGAIEAVYSVLSITEGKLFPSLNITEDMNPKAPALKEVRSEPINHVLSNSFGFGGNQTTLIFSAHG